MRANKKVAILSAPEHFKGSIKFIYYKNLKKLMLFNYKNGS